MVYTKNTWTDRSVERPLTFTQTTNADGSVTLNPSEGTIISAGTPITAAKLNNLETQYDEAVNYANGQFAPLVQDTWHGAVFQNGWTAFGSTFEQLSYRINKFGMVEGRGLAKAGVLTDGTVIYTLPAGYRPEHDVVCIVSTNDGTNDFPARVHIDTAGNVKAYKAKSGGHFQVSWIPFPAYQ